MLILPLVMHSRNSTNISNPLTDLWLQQVFPQSNPNYLMTGNKWITIQTGKNNFWIISELKHINKIPFKTF